MEAEVHRRERILAAHGAKDLSCLPPRVVVPDLVVAVDEFATQPGEHADVLESLVRIASGGRSLGIHLILASAPSGPCPRQFGQYLLRVCLRVLDAARLRDVLGHDGAARLRSSSRQSPGQWSRQRAGGRPRPTRSRQRTYWP